MDQGQATELLATSVDADKGQEQSTPDMQSGGNEQQFESFTNLDPNSLSPELQQIYKSMQSDYVRKTQGIAEYRRAYEELGEINPSEAAQAVQFVNRLTTDPQFAQEIYSDLAMALEQAGLDVATPNIGQQNEAFGEQEEINPNDQALQELLSWKNQQEQLQLEQNIVSALDRQESALRHAHPDYSQDDVDAIYQLAYSTGGDLQAANNVFQSMRNRFIENYMNAKAQAPQTPHMGSNTGQTPERITDINQASKAALERLKAVMQ